MSDIELLVRTAERQQARYFGKFRGFVADNQDPERRARVKLTIPAVLGEATSDWALPCLPYGGAAGLGFVTVPPVGASVFAEFIEGDVSAPVWTGAFWRTSEEAPEAFAAGEPTAKVLQTDSGHRLHFEDKAGEETITLTSKAGASVTLDAEGSLTLTDANGASATLDAAAGEVVVADANGNVLTLSASGWALKDSGGNSIRAEGTGVTVTAGTVTIDARQVAIGGAGGEPLVKGQSFMALFNAHTHPCTAPGSPSGPPLPLLTPGALTLATKAA